jgi:hypothetical protein
MYEKRLSIFSSGGGPIFMSQVKAGRDFNYGQR